MESVLKTVQDMLRQQYELSEAQVAPDKKLKSLGLDSLSQIEFVGTLEDRFSIVLPDAAQDINTVADIANAVERALAEGAG